MKKKITSLTKILENEVTNEEIIEKLKQGQYTLKELKTNERQMFEITNMDIGNVIRQYDKTKKDFVYYMIGDEEFPYVFLNVNSNELKVVEIADVHMGSKNFNKYEFIKMLDYLWEQGFRVIVIAGDLIDGKDAYSGHTINLRYPTGGLQSDFVVSLLSHKNFHYVVTAGNHCKTFAKTGGVDVLTLVEEKMKATGRHFTYLKDYIGHVVFNDSVIKLIHLGKGGSASATYPIQKALDEIFKTSMNDRVNEVTILNKSYPIIKVIAGHFHGLIKFVYGGVVCVAPLSFQHSTGLVKRKGIRSRCGCRVSQMIVENGECISEKGSIYFTDNLDILKKTNFKSLEHKKVKVKTKESKSSEILEKEELNKKLRILMRKKFISNDDLQLTQEQINYLNEKYKYNIYIEDNIVVFNTDDEDTSLVYSQEKGSGSVSFLELSNLLIGSKFFNENALHYILTKAKERNIKHVWLGGNIVWGKTTKDNMKYTSIFGSIDQGYKLAEILKQYPQFHYYAINGITERSFIELTPKLQTTDNDIVEEVNALYQTSTMLNDNGIKFHYVNNKKLDFIIYGSVIRMINHQRLRHPYTIDYEYSIHARLALAKSGNIVVVAGKEYRLIGTFIGSIRRTIEDFYGNTYITTSAGVAYDPENCNDNIQSTPQAAITKYFIKDGNVLKLEREIITPPKKIYI